MNRRVRSHAQKMRLEAAKEWLKNSDQLLSALLAKQRYKPIAGREAERAAFWEEVAEKRRMVEARGRECRTCKKGKAGFINGRCTECAKLPEAAKNDRRSTRGRKTPKADDFTTSMDSGTAGGSGNEVPPPDEQPRC